MSLPKKRKKDLNIKVTDPNGGPKSWVSQFTEKNKQFLPRDVDITDLDKGFFDFVKKDLTNKINYIDKPLHFLGIQRWSEFIKYWPNTDKYSNIKIPFLSINRENSPEVGSNPADYKIPNRKNFPYAKMRVWDNDTNSLNIYTIPNPVGVDLLYTIGFFSFKMGEINDIYREVSQLFASAQIYTNIKGHYFPILLEDIGDESEIEGLDGKRFYVQTYTMKLQGYIVDSEEFQIKPAVSRVFVTTELITKKLKPLITPLYDKNNKEKTIGITISFTPGSVTSLQFGSEDDIDVYTIDTDNILTYNIRINNNNVSPPFKIRKDDIIYINIVKENSLEVSDITLEGKIEN